MTLAILVAIVAIFAPRCAMRARLTMRRRDPAYPISLPLYRLR